MFQLALLLLTVQQKGQNFNVLFSVIKKKINNPTTYIAYRVEYNTLHNVLKLCFIIYTNLNAALSAVKPRERIYKFTVVRSLIQEKMKSTNLIRLKFLIIVCGLF